MTYDHCVYRFCLTDRPRRTLRSDGNEMLVLFRSFSHSLVCDDTQFPWKCHRYNIGFKAKFYTSNSLVYTLSYLSSFSVLFSYLSIVIIAVVVVIIIFT